MAGDLRDFKAEDLENFKLDPDGNLYWRGKRVRSGGWSIADRIAFGGLIVMALLTAAASYPELKTLWPDFAAKPSAVGPATSRQQSNSPD